MSKKIAAAFAAALALALFAPAARAQKALVYCPVGIDATGCDRIVAALQPKFPDGVDRGYDGTNSTVDLMKVDLEHYAVIVVPSLADDDTKQPYSVLRKAAARLHLAVNGRVAVYSGAPDQGSANRADKDAIIQNLAAWSAKGHTRATGLVGLVAFLDLSENTSSRYSWVKSVSLADVSADAETQSIADLTPSGRGGDLLASAGRAIRFSNMASYGLHIGARAAARTEVGAMSTATDSHQSVLVTYANADGKDLGTNGGRPGGASLDVSGGGGAAGPTLTTDKPDYLPGDTVLFSGTGWAPNDTVTITVHEDPQWSNPDRTVTAVADANGNLSSHDFVVQQRDFGVTLTATGVGNPSGLVAQVTFTDGKVGPKDPTIDPQTPNPVPVGNSATFLVTVHMNGTNNGPCTVTLSVTGLPTGASGSFNDNPAVLPNGHAGEDFSRTLTITTTSTTPAGSPTITVTATDGAGCQDTQSVQQTATLVVSKANQSITFVAPSGTTYGDADVDLGATASSGLAVSYASSTTAVCTIVSGKLHIVAPGSCTVTASQAGNASFNAAPNVARIFTINAKSVTPSVTANDKEYNGTATATITACTVAVKVGTDDVACTASTATFATANANAAPQTITATGITLTGSTAPNYVLATTSATTSAKITPKPATWTTNANSKTYGDADPAGLTTGSGAGFLAADGVTATYSRVAGENASPPTYHITATLSTSGLLTNYTITNTGAEFTINAKSVAPSVTASDKEYNGTNAATLTTCTVAVKVGSDDVACTAATATFATPNANAAPQTVTATGITLTGSTAPNYVLTTTSAATSAKITPKPATWTTNANSKTYGDADPVGLTTGSGAGFLAADGVTAAYSRVAGENASPPTYHITATLSTSGLLTNYTITNAGAEFTINKRPATWTTNANSKTYGNADPAGLTTGSAAGFVAADNVTATYSRTGGETVAGSPYHISATLSPVAALTNYTITNTGADFTINAKSVTPSVTASDREYNGTTAATTSCTVAVKVGSDDVACTAATATFATPNANAAPQTVTATGITLTGSTAPNYVLTTTSATTSAKITPKPATWTTNANSKTYGDADPAGLTTGSGAGFLAADGVTAAYSRVAGENASPPTYHITATLSTSGLLTNYTITNAGAEFTINKRLASVTPNPASKTYGDPEPNPLTTGTLTNFVAADNVTAMYSRTAGEAVAGGPYTISATLAPVGVLGNYTITYNTANFTINAKPVTPSVTASDREYNGTTVATTSCTVAVKVGTDDVACIAATATFATPNANAAPQTVTATGITLTGSTAPNYVLTTMSATTSAKITPKPATWTTNANSKTYGDPDPVGLTTGSGAGFLAADGVTAAYSRVAGENASPPTYHITATLSTSGLLTNYTITNTGAEFTINKRAATWTTNANSKTYGDADPSPLTTGSGSNFVAADNVTATYGRAPGETVAGGPYHVTAMLSPAAVLTNYTITNAGAEFTINAKPVMPSITASDREYNGTTAATTSCTVAVKVGSDDVACTAATATFATPNANAAPQTVTATGITLTGSTAPNYVLTTTSATTSAKITPKPATWTTNANSKTYGDPDPVGLTTGSGAGFLAADGVTAAYSRVAGENASPPTYHITATLSASGLLTNYTITNTGAEFTINKRAATWTTNANSKTYGDADPSPLTTGSGSNFVAADNVTATYGRAPGETVAGGPYHVTAMLSPAAVLTNYTITNAGAEFMINAKSVTPSVTTSDREYNGTTAATTSCTVAVKVGSDDVACTAATATFATPNANAAPQTVTATGITLTGSTAPNYVLTTTSATTSAKITPKPATWTTNANSKTYGDPDPVGLTTGSGAGFLAADGVTAAYSRVAGENASPPTYHITATLSASGLLTNYTITNTGAEFTINKRAATWTTNANSKTYGDPDPTGLTTGSGNGFLAADGVTAAYSRVAGENASPPTYHITALLSASPGLLTNYIITNAGAEFTINAKSVTPSVTTSDREYNGTTAATTSCTVAVKVGSDDVACTAATATFATPNANAAPQTVTATGITLTGSTAPNYVLTTTSATTSAKITPKPATWTTNANSKTYGDADPAGLTTGSGAGFLAADGVTAAYSRVAGENASPPTYHIIATLSTSGLLTNYSITNTGAEFTIKKRLASVTPNPASKAYGDQDPALTGTLNGFLSGDNVTATYSRPAGEAPTTYVISASLTATGLLTNYYITYNTAVFTITNDTPIITLLTGPPGPVALGSPVTVTGTFTDHGFAGDAYVVSSTWTSGANSVNVPNVGASSYNGNSGTFSITAPSSIPSGVYTVTVIVTDKWQAASTPVSVGGYIVVYDPNGGFVTGGGWINSPDGACLLTPGCLHVTGKATFGFVSKYKKGQSTPDGDTEFQFHEGNLNFKSTAYDWLVLAGTKAQYKGSGTINGSGDYGFMLTAIDGDLKSKGSPDTFRIKIWDKATGNTVYDNQPLASDTADPTTALGGGSIQIHN